MEDYLRLGLLFIAALILFLIVFDSWLRHRRLKTAQISTTASQAASLIMSNKHLEPSMQCAFNMGGDESISSVVQPETQAQPNAQPKAEMPELANDLLVISVFAKPQCQFGSYELLQAISNTGMQFGDMNIFHYYTPTDQKRKVLFSLASATKPGVFNLDRIGDLSCVGLTLFMDLREVSSEPEYAFKAMLKTAEQLAEDLDGELRAGLRTPWNAEILKEYSQKIQQFKRV